VCAGRGGLIRLGRDRWRVLARPTSTVTGHTASLDWAIEAIVDWYDAYRDGRALRTVTLEQSKAFGR
jgi:hypothetical protein